MLSYLFNRPDGMGSFVRNKSILTIITIGTLLTVASMAVYKIALRVNGADVPPPPPSSTSAALEQNDKEPKGSGGKQIQEANSPNMKRSSSNAVSHSMAKFTAGRTFTPQYQQQLYQKTVKLIVTRTILNRKLSRAFSQRDKFSHKLLDRHYRLKHQESKHLAARIRLLAELQKQYKLNPSAQRAKDVRLVRKLLRSFKNHLKTDQYAHKYQTLRPSLSRSASTSPSTSDMEDHEAGIHNAIVTIAAEQLDAGMLMTTANGSLRKRRASQRSNASLTTLFAQDHPETVSGGDDGALAVAKKNKKLKLDLEDDQKRPVTVAAPLSTESIVDKEGKGDANPDKKPQPGSEDGRKPPADAGPSVTKVVASTKEVKAEVDTEAAPSPTTPVFSNKEKRGSVDTAASASPNGSKKHPLDSDDAKPSKTKKAKVEADSPSVTSAVPAASPKKTKPVAAATTALVPSKKYHEQAVYEMLNDPLGFDDLVYDDTRPMNKRPKFGRLGFRYKKPPPNFSPLMCGGIGRDLPQDTTAQMKRKEKGDLKREGSLSQSVLKKNHRDKVGQKVQESKAAAAHQKSKSRLDGLTEKSKYSVNKEARFGRSNNKATSSSSLSSSCSTGSNNPGSGSGAVVHKSKTKNNNFKGGANGNKAANISSARRQLHAVRSQYSLFT